MFRLARCGVLLLAMASVALTSAVLAAEDDPPGAYKASSPEPTPLETLLLEYINRCRADPGGDGLRCAATKGQGSVDLNMFKREMFQQAPVPPVFFDLRLLKAARWHSNYQIRNAQTHDEEPEAEGFSGKTPSDRAKRAGFPGGASENIIREDQDPWRSHWGFVVDWGPGGTGGMQPGRGHRRNILDPSSRLAGIGIVPHANGARFATTHNFASIDKRWLGGVVLNDLNKNRFYDLGEGVSGISLSVGETKTTSWTSGAYALAIPKSAARLVVELAGKKYAVYLPAGSDNIKFDIYVSDRTAFDRGPLLLEAIKKIDDTEANSARRFNALIDLHLAAQHALLPEGIVDEVRTLTETSAKTLQQDMAEVRQAIGKGEADEARKLTTTCLTKYAKTRTRLWFAEAGTCLQIKDSYLRLVKFRDSGKTLTPAVVEPLLAEQQQKLAGFTVPEWRFAAAEHYLKTGALTTGSGKP